MLTLGYDIGSSSIKASIIEVESGNLLASASYPPEEMKIISKENGWAEQEPELWWDYLKILTKNILTKNHIDGKSISCIGISYQMHGLVVVDKNQKVLRPSIIWCDSRAVNIGTQAFEKIGAEKCLSHLLNSPGNFTASKLKWVKDNEPDIYDKIYKIMLPGDFIAMKLTGEISTTISGLSEGMMWDYTENSIADFLLNHYGFSKDIIPDVNTTFCEQGKVSPSIANELGLKAGIPVSYRAGDQPNNALSLNVLNPGEVATTAGTSGVVYGVSDKIKYDTKSRVNTFAHVNHTKTETRLGVLLCINGTGILNSWLKNNIALSNLNYNEINKLAAKVNPLSDGVLVLPFGNGAERMLENKNIGAKISGINLNIHNRNHLLRAAQEGIVFSFKYGMDIMNEVGINPSVIRAGNANMFLSPIFRESLATVSGAVIELYDTDGSQGAAKGAAYGAGFYSNLKEAFKSLKKNQVIEPVKQMQNKFIDAYELWKQELNKHL